MLYHYHAFIIIGGIRTWVNPMTVVIEAEP